MRLEAILDAPLARAERGARRGVARAGARRGVGRARSASPVHAAAAAPAAPASRRGAAPTYHPISRNRYVSRARMYGTTPACQCDPATGDCGEQCMNRMMQIVCTPRTCPCAPRCTNGSLGKRAAPALEIVEVRDALTQCGKRGLGLQTPVRVRKGAFLGEYCGELIDLPEAARRVREHYEHTHNYYFVDYNTWAGELLDAGLRGNKIRFVNHSCEPNCKMEKWLVSGSEQDHTAEFQLGLFALRDIEAGEELSYNYGWSAFRPIDVASGEEGEAYTPMRCFCGAPSCTGWLGRARKAPQSSRPPSPVTALPSATPVPPKTGLRAKRPRGRPRKDAQLHDADGRAAAGAGDAQDGGAAAGAGDAQDSPAETPRRKRGRPRKHPPGDAHAVRAAADVGPSAPRAAAEPVPKRRRGRPSRSDGAPSTGAPAVAEVLDTSAPDAPAQDAAAPPPALPRRRRGRRGHEAVAGAAASEPDGAAEARAADVGAEAGAEGDVAARVPSPVRRARGRPRKSGPLDELAALPARAPTPPAPRPTPPPAEPLAMPVGVYFTLTPTQVAHISAQPHRRRGRPRVRPVFPHASPPRWRRPAPESDEAAVRALLL
ncbi:hypothetical protein MBRA1_002690 [Malassezia brasiliensis]|uniref:Uncharacterized protein n=1 Tax=Malassezia brasiliensis TaxID=1821822 RepID=A0AAF0DUN2_9BASI|nr:hypothetical protein MBRA1_002690 [Malassezia brasiliensis]